MNRFAWQKPAQRLSFLVGTTLLLSTGCAMTTQTSLQDASTGGRAQAIVGAENAARAFMRRHQVQGLSIAVVDSRDLIWSGFHMTR